MNSEPETHCELGMGWTYCMRKREVGPQPILGADVVVSKAKQHLVTCKKCRKRLDDIEAARARCPS